MVTSLPLFPIPICLYNYGEDSHELNIQLVTDILNESDRDPRGKQNSNFGGWHSKSDLEIKYPSFNSLRNFSLWNIFLFAEKVMSSA